MNEAKKPDQEKIAALMRGIAFETMMMPVIVYFVLSFASPELLKDFGVPTVFEGWVNLVFALLAALLGSLALIRAVMPDRSRK